VPNIMLNHLKIHSPSDFPYAINSIRRSGHDGKRQRSEANDVSLLWRHSSWVHSRTLERAYRRSFLTVFGEFEPQNVVGHRVDPKKTLPYVTTRVLSHRVWNSMDGLLQ